MSNFAADVRLLNDTLTQTALQDHYFLWGGLLLGWAREGKILDWDDGDADLGYYRADRARFLQAVPTLVAAGFCPRSVWFDNSGEITRYAFLKDGAAFDFFELVPQNTEDLYWMHVPVLGAGAWIELVGAVPNTGYTLINFLDRRWLIPTDYDAFLTACYGDWRTPIPRNQYNYVAAGMRLHKHSLWVGSEQPVIFLAPDQPDFSSAQRKKPQGA